MRILLVGNSFMLGVRTLLKALVRSYGEPDIVIGTRAVYGWLLSQHASSPRTMQAIADGNWDFVVMQNQSDGIDSVDYAYVRNLDTLIRDAGGLPVMMMTWRDRGDALSTYDSLKGTYPGGTFGYVPIAFEIGAPVAPAGWLFREAVDENSAINLWNKDRHHANPRGRYFAAMSIFCAIYGVTPVGLRAPSSLRDFKEHDQALANTVCITDAATWNITPFAP
jgi:hypothetical protein